MYGLAQLKIKEYVERPAFNTGEIFSTREKVQHILMQALVQAQMDGHIGDFWIEVDDPEIKIAAPIGGETLSTTNEEHINKFR